MSDKEKKPQQAKPKYHSRGLRGSGGRVPKLNFPVILGAIINPTPLGGTYIGQKVNPHLKKAAALVRRAQGHRLAAGL